MTASLRLDATANQTFRLTLSLAALAQTTALDDLVFRMDARRAGADLATAPAFRWATSGETGLIQVDTQRAHIVILAALKDIRRLFGKYDFDLRADLPTRANELLASGPLVVARGVTTDESDATADGVIGVGDTVRVSVDSASQPAALPMNATRVMVAADAARADAQLAAAQAAAAVAAFEAMKGDVFICDATGAPRCVASSTPTATFSTPIRDARGVIVCYVAPAPSWPAIHRITDATRRHIAGYAP